MSEEDKQSILSRRSNSCITILLNILAGPDYELAPYLDDLFISIGGNIAYVSLYYNLFQIQQEDNTFKLALFQSYVKLLSNNTSYLL